MTREEAIEVYNGLINTKIKEAFEFFVPELRESEDEQALRIIKKRMCYDPVPISDEDRRIVEAWLEKQKEPDKCPEYCVRSHCMGCSIYEKQKEQKPQGVYVDCTEHPEWYGMPPKEQKPNYCHYGGDPNVERCRYCSAACSVRLTEGQKPVEIHIDNPNIQKLDPNVVVETRTDGTNPNVVNESLTYQPVEWSEEDELMRTVVIQTLETLGGRGTTGMQIDWLKSLRPQPQKLEDWTEEDEKLLSDALACVTMVQEIKKRGELKNFHISCTGEELRSWIRSLKSRPRKQPHWKPSEEQMKALIEAMQETRPGWLFNRQLVSLYDDLKKL